MSAWLVGHSPWLLPVRSGLRLDPLHSRVWLRASSHLNIALQTPSPSSLEMETMPYPTVRPDADVFEPMSQEYASISAHGAREFTPLTSSDTLASLVAKSDFRAAELLRKEMISHRIPIPQDTLYLRAALHEITERRPKGSAKERLEAFEAWLSLVPDRHVKWQPFHDVRQRIFRNMDHLNLSLVYRFGIVLASKGYHSGHIAMQVVLTLARYGSLSVVEKYLRDMEEASRQYDSRMDASLSSTFLFAAYNRAARTIAIRGEADAALRLISVARSRNFDIHDFTLSMVAKHAPNQQLAINHIRTLYPSWTMKDTDTFSSAGARADTTLETETDCTEITTLAARLRSLRNAIRSPSPPSPHALYSFITSYRSLKRTRALDLLSSAAYRHSPKSAAAWVLTEMLHHRSRREHTHVLLTFSHHFQPVGVPRKTLLSLIRGPLGRQAKRERMSGLASTRYPIKERLWPSGYHTALVWDAIVWLSPEDDRERLYRLLLKLVKQSKQQESVGNGSPKPKPPGSDHTRVELSPDTFDAAHFSPFVLAWVQGYPEKAGGVLRDMVDVGIQPTMIQWSIVARGFAQHGDPLIVFRILDRVEERHRLERDNTDTQQDTNHMEPSDELLGLFTNVLRGFVIRDDVEHAREVERRMVEQFGYQPGDRPATDASIGLLRNLEARSFS